MTYATPENLLALAIFFMNLTTLLVLLRYVTIRMTRHSIGLDDIALTTSWLFSTAICVNMITATAYDLLGRILPPPVNSLGQYDPYYGHSAPVTALAKFFYAQEVLLPPALACSKLAIVLFYRRTLVIENRGFTHWATIVAITLIGLWGASFFFTIVFQCGTRFSLIWDGPIIYEDQFCVSTDKDVSFAATDLALDLFIAVLPLRRIFTLKLTLAKKFQVACAFMLGALSVAGAAARFAMYMSMQLQIVNSFTAEYPTIRDGIIMYWGAFEVGFAVTTASLPGLRPFFNRVAGAFDQHWSTLREKSLRSESAASGSIKGFIMVRKEYKVEVNSP